ncbi:MAG: class I SAM-dependent methyltransferase [Bacteroidaceae bacterium]|nr:class I SAM-dependent methyltransferase [Bacteroidaceae bacterium]
MQEYIESHSSPEHPYLHALWRATHLHLNYPRMASGHLQGQVLRMLVQMIRPHLVLEIGTFTGYSALAMASALEPGAMLHTYEINDEQEDFTRPWIENSPWADRVTLHIEDILQACLQDVFDMVFIDADKRHYLDYYNAVFPHVRPSGYILADNTLWGGQVAEPAPLVAGDPSVEPPRPVSGGSSAGFNAKSSQLRGILAFNDYIAADPRVEKVILPLRDGLTLIRKIET